MGDSFKDAPIESLDEDAHHAPESGADSHGRNKDARRHFAAVRDDDEAGPDDGRE